MQKLPSSTSNSGAPLAVNGNKLATLRSELFKDGSTLVARVVSSRTKGEVKLQVGDIKLSALTPMEVKTGDVVNLKVIKVGQSLQFQIISLAEIEKSGQQSISHGGKLSSERSAEASTGLLKIVSLTPKLDFGYSGQVEAKVLSNSSTGTVRLQIGDGEFEGYSSKVLKPDQSVILKMVADGRQPQLQIIDPKGVTTSLQPAAPESNNNRIKIVTPELLKGLKEGDLVQAKVLKNQVKGQLSLKVADVVIKVETTLQPSKEEALYLRVVKGGEYPILESITSRAFTQQLKMNAYRQALPRQQSVAEGLQKLLDVAQTKTDNLPLTIKESMATLFKHLLTPDRAALPVEMRQALSNTGIFTESKLLAGTLMQGDLKLELGQLISLIKPALRDKNIDLKRSRSVGSATSPTMQGSHLASLQTLLGELLRSSDGAMAKIQAQQLASLPQEDTGQQSWHFEFPILNGETVDQFNIVVDQGAASETDEETTPWSITLQMNLTPLGPMRVQLKLKERTISTIFWAEEKKTLALLNKNITTLQDAFERAGLEVAELKIFHGVIKPITESLPEALSLLNVKV